MKPIASIVVLVHATLSGCAREDKSDAEDGSTDTGNGEVGEGTSGGSSGTDDATTDDSEDDDATDGNDGCAFPGCPDFIDPPPSCDIWAQDCPDGEKCTAYDEDGNNAWDAHKCVPIDPQMDQPGEPCQDIDELVDGLDTCDKGGLCWDVDLDTLEGYCIAFCTGSPMAPICEDGDLCSINGSAILPICTPDCDPLAIDCPMAESVCTPHPGDEGFICLLDASGGMGSFGVICMYNNSCNPGLFCANAEEVPGCAGEACCSEFCDVNEPNTCSGMSGGQECIPWWEMGMAPMGLEHIGGCAVP